MKKTIIIILLILLISLVSVSAKEYTINVGDKATFEGKTITLNNVGSGGAINVDVDGLIFVIYASSTQNANGVEIYNIETFYDSNDVSQRSATIGLYKPGVVCYMDNFCDYEKVQFGRRESISNYRLHSIDIKEHTSYAVTLTVDGTETTLYSSGAVSLENKDPKKTFGTINSVGLRYTGNNEGTLYLGENFDNCPVDCTLNDQSLIYAFCYDGEKSEATKEENVDCGGLCIALPAKLECGKVGMNCEKDDECDPNICYENKCFECEEIDLPACDTSLFVPLGNNEATGCNLGYTCCGDSVCNGKEDAQICPLDCYVPPVEEVFCTQDVKLCSDGSYVSRIAPDCNFAKCPIAEEEVEEKKHVITSREEEKIVGNYSDVEIEETLEYEEEDTKEDSIKGKPNNIFYHIFNFFRGLFG